jgi:hypothetical protein
MSTQPTFNREPLGRFWYRKLIGLYPGVFRDRYAVEMLRVFEEDWSRVSGQRGSARWRYWVHVLGDLARAVPGKWLSVMTLVTRVGSIGITVALFLYLLGHQWLTVAYWLFLCGFMVVGWMALILPSRLGVAASSLLAGVLGIGGFWSTRLLAGYIHGPTPDDSIWVFGLTVAAMLLGTLITVSIGVASSLGGLPSFWMVRKPAQSGPNKNLRFRSVLFTLSILMTGGAQFFVGHRAMGQLLMGALLAGPCRLVASQLYAIWHNAIPSGGEPSEPRSV